MTQRHLRDQSFPLSDKLSIYETEKLAPVLISSLLGTQSALSLFQKTTSFILKVSRKTGFPPNVKAFTEKSLNLTLSPGKTVSSASISKISVFQEHITFPLPRKWREARILHYCSFLLWNLSGDSFSMSCLIHPGVPRRMYGWLVPWPVFLKSHFSWLCFREELETRPFQVMPSNEGLE